MTIELNTLAPKKWVADYSGIEPTIDSTDGVSVGDFAIDTSTDPYTVWVCSENTEAAAIWFRNSPNMDVGIVEIALTGVRWTHGGRL